VNALNIKKTKTNEKRTAFFNSGVFLGVGDKN